jgi:hypothetical protein
MNQSTNPPTRNTLGPAYACAEGLYDNAVALSQILDAYSKRHRAPALTADARDYISHNLLNAENNLARLRLALTHALTTGETQWHPNADSAAAAAEPNAPTPTAPPPAAPSTTNATNGNNTCPPTPAPTAATTT